MTELDDWYYLVRKDTNLRYLQADRTPLAVHFNVVDRELSRCECRTGGEWEAISVPEYQKLFGE